jgi:hypothetical protein
MAAAPRVFLEIVPESWELARHLSRRLWGWIFRGQEELSWELVTTLDRGPEYRRYERWRLPAVERFILEQFQRRAVSALADRPPLDDLLEWTALLQQHGGPTRLLEFTSSFWVAAFFAIERGTGGEQSAAIWAVNPQRLRAEGSGKLAAGWRDFTLESNLSSEELLDAPAQLYRFLVQQQRPPKLVFRVDPHRMSERMAAQQGLYLTPFDLEATFEDNLFGTFDASPAAARGVDPTVWRGRASDPQLSDYAIVKVVVPGAMHKHAALELRTMNLTAATLFPGLEGFARALHYHLGEGEES